MGEPLALPGTSNPPELSVSVCPASIVTVAAAESFNELMVVVCTFADVLALRFTLLNAPPRTRSCSSLICGVGGRAAAGSDRNHPVIFKNGRKAAKNSVDGGCVGYQQADLGAGSLGLNVVEIQRAANAVAGNCVEQVDVRAAGLPVSHG